MPLRPGTGRDRRILVAAAFVAAVGIAGLLVIRWASGSGITEILPARANIFWVLLARHEAPFFALLTLTAAAAALVFRRSVEIAGRLTIPSRRTTGLVLAALSVAVLAFSRWGQSAVLWSLRLSMDEFGPWFQSRIFKAGLVEGSIPEVWRPFASALTPFWVRYDARTGGWVSEYLPGYAVLQAIFDSAGLPTLTNPVLASGAIIAIYVAARRLWPEDVSSAVLAAVLLASTPQFLLTSMTWYTMPAHLFLNTVWIACSLSPRRAVAAATPWVGGVAMLLHQPIPHALFATPFLIRLLRERRFARLSYYAAVYGLFATAGIVWLRFASSQWEGGGVFRRFAAPASPFLLALQVANAALLFSWQSPLVPLLLGVAALSYRRLRPVERDLLWGIVLTFSVYMLFPSDQGHGWGYRYAYNVLANVVLLGVVGWRLLAPARGGRVAFAALTAFGLAVLLPLRLLQCREFVKPFARAFEITRDPSIEVLIVDPLASWYGLDLVRNDPFLGNTPKVLLAPALTAEMRSELERKFPRRVVTLPPEVLARAGVPSWRLHAGAGPDGKPQILAEPLPVP